jgi:hypothetical protein
MDATDVLNDAFEQSWNKWLNLFYFTNLKNFLKLGKEKGFFDTISKRPIFKETFE